MTIDIASLMLPVDGDHPGDGQLQDVGALAAELGAGIIGISVCEHAPSLYYEAGATAQDLIEEDERRLKERMAAAEKRFRKALAGRGIPIEWRSSVDIPIDFVIRESRAADLIVCFSRREAAPYSDVEPGELVLKSGRPALVVSEGAAWRSPSKILVAWKDAREARRAVQDSLPFLLEAEAIYVVGVGAEGTEEETQQQIVDVRQYLVRHRITTTTGMVLRLDENATRPLMRVVRNENIDLVVAGAYGHSRFGEWAFGGVTRDLLRTCPVCCLLSH